MLGNELKAMRLGAASKLLGAAVLCALGTPVHAQSSVTVYGLVETGIRQTSNQLAIINGAASSGSKTAFADGLINPSRLGFKGEEDLGGGMKAFFDLENGFRASNGTSNTGNIGYLENFQDATKNRIFDRQAAVGVAGEFGKLTLGRQYTTAFIQSWGFDPIYGGGLVTWQPSIAYTGVRQDNMVSYAKSFGAVSFGGHVVAGETAGNSSLGRGYGIGGGYAADGFNLNAAYQQSNSTVAGAAVPTMKVALIGGGYAMGAGKVSLGYFRNTLTGSAQKNNVLHAAFTYGAAPWSFIASVQRDKQTGADGTHTLFVGMADYALSKRTALFLEADYHKVEGAFATAGAPTNATGLTLGMRHAF